VCVYTLFNPTAVLILLRCPAHRRADGEALLCSKMMYIEKSYICMYRERVCVYTLYKPTAALTPALTPSAALPPPSYRADGEALLCCSPASRLPRPASRRRLPAAWPAALGGRRAQDRLRHPHLRHQASRHRPRAARRRRRVRRPRKHGEHYPTHR